MNPPCAFCKKTVYPTEKFNCLDKVSYRIYTSASAKSVQPLNSKIDFIWKFRFHKYKNFADFLYTFVLL